MILPASLPSRRLHILIPAFFWKMETTRSDSEGATRFPGAERREMEIKSTDPVAQPVYYQSVVADPLPTPPVHLRATPKKSWIKWAHHILAGAFCGLVVFKTIYSSLAFPITVLVATSVGDGGESFFSRCDASTSFRYFVQFCAVSAFGIEMWGTVFPISGRPLENRCDYFFFSLNIFNVLLTFVWGAGVLFCPCVRGQLGDWFLYKMTFVYWLTLLIAQPGIWTAHWVQVRSRSKRVYDNANDVMFVENVLANGGSPLQPARPSPRRTPPIARIDTVRNERREIHVASLRETGYRASAVSILPSSHSKHHHHPHHTHHSHHQNYDACAHISHHGHHHDFSASYSHHDAHCDF